MKLPRKKRLTPAMREALDLLKQNPKGIVQTGTENVIMCPRDPKTNRRIQSESRSVSNQTLLALKRRGLIYCVHLLPSRRLNAAGRRNPKHQRRRWKVRDEA